MCPERDIVLRQIAKEQADLQVNGTLSRKIFDPTKDSVASILHDVCQYFVSLVLELAVTDKILCISRLQRFSCVEQRP